MCPTYGDSRWGHNPLSWPLAVWLARPLTGWSLEASPDVSYRWGFERVISGAEPVTVSQWKQNRPTSSPTLVSQSVGLFNGVTDNSVGQSVSQSVAPMA